MPSRSAFSDQPSLSQTTICCCFQQPVPTCGCRLNFDFVSKNLIKIVATQNFQFCFYVIQATVLFSNGCFTSKCQQPIACQITWYILKSEKTHNFLKTSMQIFSWLNYIILFILHNICEMKTSYVSIYRYSTKNH